MVRVIISFFLLGIYDVFKPLSVNNGIFGDGGVGMLVVFICYFYIAWGRGFCRINVMTFSHFSGKNKVYLWFVKKQLIFSVVYVTVVLAQYLIIQLLIKESIFINPMIGVRYFVFTIINLTLLSFVAFLIRVQYNNVTGISVVSGIIGLAYITAGYRLEAYNVSFIATAYTEANNNVRLQLVIIAYIILLFCLSFFVVRGKKVDMQL